MSKAKKIKLIIISVISLIIFLIGLQVVYATFIEFKSAGIPFEKMDFPFLSSISYINSVNNQIDYITLIDENTGKPKEDNINWGLSMYTFNEEIQCERVFCDHDIDLENGCIFNLNRNFQYNDRVFTVKYENLIGVLTKKLTTPCEFGSYYKDGSNYRTIIKDFKQCIPLYFHDGFFYFIKDLNIYDELQLVEANNSNVNKNFHLMKLNLKTNNIEDLGVVDKNGDNLYAQSDNFKVLAKFNDKVYITRMTKENENVVYLTDIYLNNRKPIGDISSLSFLSKDSKLAVLHAGNNATKDIFFVNLETGEKKLVASVENVFSLYNENYIYYFSDGDYYKIKLDMDYFNDNTTIKPELFFSVNGNDEYLQKINDKYLITLDFYDVKKFNFYIKKDNTYEFYKTTYTPEDKVLTEKELKGGVSLL